MNYKLPRERFVTLTPIIEEKSFFSLDSLRTPSPKTYPKSLSGKAVGEPAKVVRLPPIADVGENVNTRRPRPNRLPTELDSLIGGYLSQTVESKPSLHIGYDPTLYCECCEPINNVSQARLKEFSSGLLSPAEEPDPLGHFKAKDSKRPGIPKRQDTLLEQKGTKGMNLSSFVQGRPNQVTNPTTQHSYYNNKNAHAHQPYFVAASGLYSQNNREPDLFRYVHNPRIYVDTSKANIPSSFLVDRALPKPETPPIDQRRFDMQYMNTVMDAASKFDNSMEALEGTIRSLRSDKRVTIDEMENTYRHFDKSSREYY